MKLKFYLTPDFEKFTNLVEQSEGNIFLELPDNSLCNLKNNEVSTELLVQVINKGHKITICLTENKDYFRFVSFMMGGCV